MHPGRACSHVTDRPGDPQSRGREGSAPAGSDPEMAPVAAESVLESVCRGWFPCGPQIGPRLAWRLGGTAMWSHRLRQIAAFPALMFAGCVAKIGPTRTDTIDVPRPLDATGTWDLALYVSAGEVTVGAEGDRLVQGTITYNVDGLKPAVTVEGRRVRIFQDAHQVLPLDTRNEWRLQLGRGVPMNLRVVTGGSSDEWDLGGLSLRRMEWVQGAGRATLNFGAPNPEPLERLSVNGGASALTMRGLANANLRLATFTAGVGDVTLVFDGRLSRSAEVKLIGGVASIAIHSGGNPIRLTAPGRAKVLLNSGWSRRGGVYLSPECANASGPQISIDTRLGLSALHLVAGT
jgi:hypothetical protein